MVWADNWFKREGKYPVVLSGNIPETMGEAWSNIQTLLRVGLHGLPGGSSLSRLLKKSGRK